MRLSGSLISFFSSVSACVFWVFWKLAVSCHCPQKREHVDKASISILCALNASLQVSDVNFVWMSFFGLFFGSFLCLRTEIVATRRCGDPASDPLNSTPLLPPSNGREKTTSETELSEWPVVLSQHHSVDSTAVSAVWRSGLASPDGPLSGSSAAPSAYLRHPPTPRYLLCHSSTLVRHPPYVDWKPSSC